MPKQSCGVLHVSLDDMYKVWRNEVEKSVDFSPQSRDIIHGVFIMGMRMLIASARHLDQHADPADLKKWLHRAEAESYAFVKALETTGVCDFGLGPAAAEAARLLVEEGRESKLHYDPDGGDIRFTLELMPMPSAPPAPEQGEEALERFLEEWKPGGGKAS